MKHEQAREEGAERSARLSQSQVLAVSYGAQWKPLRQASLSLPELPDQLWGNARNATVWVEDPYRGGGPSLADGDATRQLTGYRMLQEFLPPPYTPPGAIGHDCFDMEQLQVADLLDQLGDPALIPALHETLVRVWQVEHDAPENINRAGTEHWWLYQDELAYASGQLSAFDAFAGLDVPGAHKCVWMVNLALGYLNAKVHCRNYCIGLIGDPVSAAAYQELYPFLIQVLQQHIGLSREEATAYVQGYGSDYFSPWDTPCGIVESSNEAEVESKFVVPLFQHLGYPEGCRRPQYPLKTYEPGTGRRGRKPTIDQIYFSTPKPEEQAEGTSLIIVEAKEPNETHLDDVLEQARFYGYHLTPLFLVVTNAHRLLVVKRHGYRGEEQVFDVTIRQLQEQATASQLYHQLRFDVVKRLKEQLTDELTHTLYVDLMHTLDGHPDLRDRLAKGDFGRSRTQEGRRLTAVEPKVAVVCDLPLAFGDGACRITFSNVLLQGLTCHLTHRQILESLMTGLDTPPHWGTRRFLRKIDSLSEHVRRIHLVEHESSQVADYLSCAFIALLEDGTIHCGQEHLNAAKDAVLPLLDLSRFEERYVLRPPWE